MKPLPIGSESIPRVLARKFDRPSSRVSPKPTHANRRASQELQQREPPHDAKEFGRSEVAPFLLHLPSEQPACQAEYAGVRWARAEPWRWTTVAASVFKPCRLASSV